MNQAVSNQSDNNNNQSATTNSRWQNHLDRAEVIGRYGEAFKKFDWLIYILVALLLLIISLLAAYFVGTLSASICASMSTAALILLRKKPS